MRHRCRGRKLSRNSQERKALLRSLARSLFLSKDGRIVTTPAKAKEATPFIHKLVTLGRHGTLSDVRRVHALLPDRTAAHKLLREIVPQYASRPGGYTRILHLGGTVGRFRAWGVGDASDRVMLELVDFRTPEAAPPEGEAAEAKPERKGVVGKLKERVAGKRKASPAPAANE